MMNNLEDEDVFCEPCGVLLHSDLDGNQFYSQLRTSDGSFQVGDCVHIRLNQSCGGNLAVGLITCIYENPDQYAFCEVMWFDFVEEVEDLFGNIDVVDDEIVQTLFLDDVPAGSIVEKVRIIADPGEEEDVSDSSYSRYFCRYRLTENRKSILPTKPECFLKDGLKQSHYRHVYSSPAASGFLSSLDEFVIDWYSYAISRLHISVLPRELPCREKEMKSISDFIRSGIRDLGGNSMYISGLPGTGKTACVKVVVRNLMVELKSSNTTQLEFVEINCLSLTKPSQAYSILYRALTKEHVSPTTALAKLTAMFDINNQFHSNSVSNRILICLLDEMDFLLSRNSNVLYNLLNWPMKASSGLIFIGIANTLDLPSMVSKAIGSRTLGTSVVFEPYNHSQISEILHARIGDILENSTNNNSDRNTSKNSVNQLPKKDSSFPSSTQCSSLVDRKTLEFIARKAASMSGDLRSALKICQRFLEISRDYDMGKWNDSQLKIKKTVDSTDLFSLQWSIVNKIVEEHQTFPPRAMLRESCCILDKAILVAFCKHFKATGGDFYMTLEMIWDRFLDLLDWFLQQQERMEGIGDAKRDHSKNLISNNSCIPGIDLASQLTLPPVEIFDLAVERLVDSDLLAKIPWKSLRNNGSTLLVPSLRNHRTEDGNVERPRSSFYSPRMEYREILDALSEDALIAYIK